MSLKILFKFVKKSDNLQLNGSYFLSKGEPQMRGRAFLNATTELLGHSVPPPTQNTRRRFSAEGTKDFFSDSNKHTNLLILLDIRIKYYQSPLLSLWKCKRKWNGRMCYMLKIRGGTWKSPHKATCEFDYRHIQTSSHHRCFMRVWELSYWNIEVWKFFMHVPRNHRNIWSELRTPFKTKLIMLRSEDAIQNAPL